MSKKFIAVLILSSLAIAPLTPASIPDAIHHENWWYQTLSDYEVVLTPITGAVVCGSAAGLPGVALGFLVGATDEALIYAGYASQAHLTSGILGASMGSMLNAPYYLGHIIGFSLGGGLSLGLIEVDSSTLTAPLSAMVAGASLAHATGRSGLAGASVGLVANVIDNSDIYSGGYLTQCVSSANTVAVLKPAAGYLVSFVPVVGMPLLSMIRSSWFEGAVISGLVFYDNYSGQSAVEIETDISTPEALKGELDSLFKRVTGTDIVAHMSRKQAVYKIGASVFSNLLSVRLASLNQQFMAGLGNLGPHNPVAQTAFRRVLWSFAGFLVPFIARSIADGVIKEYQSETLGRILRLAIKEKIMSGEAPIYLKANVSLDADVKKFETHVETLSNSGLSLIWSTTDTYTTALYSSLLLYKNNALDVVSFLKSYSLTVEKLISMLQQRQHEINLKIEKLEIKIEKFENDIKDESRTVIAGNKLEFLQRKIAGLEKEVRMLSALNFKWQTIYSVISSAQGLANSLLSFGLVGAKASAGKLDGSSIFSAQEASSQLLYSGNWYLKNQVNIKEVKLAKEAITRVLDYLNKPCDERSNLEVNYGRSHENALQLNDFSVGIASLGKELLKPSSLILHAGRYVVTGKSGSGKSSFLSKIRGIICNGIYANGSLLFTTRDGIRPNVLEVTQKDYIPPYSSLLEILTGKTAEQLVLDEEIRQRARYLLTTLQLDDQGSEGLVRELDVEKNWGDTLSGGQKRKISIAAMLLKKPKFVILDETFAGLDEDSIKIAQKLIREELKDSVVLVVDHQADGNNHDNFYEFRLHLENQALELTDLASSQIAKNL